MVTGLGAGRPRNQGLILDRISRFSLFHMPRPIFCVMFIWGSFHGGEANMFLYVLSVLRTNGNIHTYCSLRLLGEVLN
jgi:uncharacterized membrane protein